ncbi:hypothetical protein D3C73_851230 [compost metagenome]
MFQNSRHRLLQPCHFQQPFIARSAERYLDARLACFFAQRVQSVFKMLLQMWLRRGLQSPAQVDCPLCRVVWQGLAELHRRTFTTGARAVLGKGSQTTVFTGLPANKARILGGGFEVQERVGRGQLPFTAEVIHSAYSLQDVFKRDNTLLG